LSFRGRAPELIFSAQRLYASIHSEPAGAGRGNGKSSTGIHWRWLPRTHRHNLLVFGDANLLSHSTGSRDCFSPLSTAKRHLPGGSGVVVLPCGAGLK